MAKTRISEWSSTPANNTDIDSINIAEGCAPSGINDAIRELMSQVKDLYAGTSGDIIAVAAGGTGVGTSTGSGNNVLSTSPTLVTPALGTPSALVGTNITGTAANFNINGTVGATTANTGAFTTLNATGTITSTKDGLIFSQSATSTAIQYGTFTNTGNSMYWGLEGSAGGQLVGGSTAYDTSFRTSFNGFSFGTSAALYARISSTGFTAYAGGSEQMRLTSTGLGIGTSSPSVKLQVTTATASSSIDTNSTMIGVGGTADATSALRLIGFGFKANTYYPTYIGAVQTSNAGNTYSDLVFYTRSVTTDTAPTERMRLDSAGNLGLGVTPSAWGTFKAIQIGSQTSISDNGSGIGGFAVNAYNSGANWTYITTAASSQYYQYLGTHVWRTAPSGTAGNAISFTQAMTLNASGGLQTLNTVGVGNATPSTSGAGITFPATQSASTDANTLDDYEEGTWTPTDQSGAVLSLTTPIGYYTKIGNLVTATLAVTYPITASTSSSAISIPMQSANVGASMFAGACSYTNAGTILCGFVGTNSSKVFFSDNTNQITNVSLSTKIVRMTVSYQV